MMLLQAMMIVFSMYTTSDATVGVCGCDEKEGETELGASSRGRRVFAPNDSSFGIEMAGKAVAGALMKHHTSQSTPLHSCALQMPNGLTHHIHPSSYSHRVLDAMPAGCSQLTAGSARRAER